MKWLARLIVRLAVFAGIGFIAGELARPWLVVGLHNPFWAIFPYAGTAGAIAGAGVMLLFGGLRRLAGLRKSRRRVVKSIKFGPLQAVWLVVGFVVAALAGMVVFLLLLNIVRLLAMVITHRPPLFDAAGPGANVAATLAGSLSAAWWSVWYIRRRGRARLTNGDPTGIAWRSASWVAYGTAVFAAFCIILVVLAMVHFLPPDAAKLANLPDAQLYDAPGWPAAGILLLVVCIAPPLEEFVFRGGVFAAIATRYSPLTAGIVTTLVFVALHAPEKIHYPPGFIDVGLAGAAAAWMRVKFGSIRPGILLHVLYNAGLLAAAGLAG